MAAGMTRRTFVAGLVATSSLPQAPSRLPRAKSRGADYSFVQYHNQTDASLLHRHLVVMWASIRQESGGRLEAQVFAENNRLPSSDPGALKMLAAGEIQFFTLMGGILGALVPAAEAQQVPFAFRSAAHAHQAMDGPLGTFIRAEMSAKGIHGFAVGAFDNGMRQIAGTKHPIVIPADLAGMRIRVPAGRMFADLFAALGAEPSTINVNQIYSSLASGKVDAQENPLAVVQLFRLYEVVKFVSLTNHMWSGFNLLAHQATWRRLPGDLQRIVERNVAGAVRRQRQDQERENVRLRTQLASRGLAFNDVDGALFRPRLDGFYKTWKERLGTRCWTLLEQAVGKSL
jgi:TRAP-type transport system periplasmic protein